MADEYGLALLHSLFSHSYEESDTPFAGCILKGEESRIDGLECHCETIKFSRLFCVFTCSLFGVEKSL